ncbi:hypothetical protein LCGC14_2092990, partial [marine sediment metagenome]
PDLVCIGTHDPLVFGSPGTHMPSYFIILFYHVYKAFSCYNRIKMIDPQIVQTIIQGGAVGLLLVFGVMGYRVLTMVVDRVSVFVNNHLEHNTEAIREQTEVTRQMKTEIVRMSAKLDGNIVRKVNSEGWELRD